MRERPLENREKRRRLERERERKGWGVLKRGRGEEEDRKDRRGKAEGLTESGVREREGNEEGEGR